MEEPLGSEDAATAAFRRLQASFERVRRRFSADGALHTYRFAGKLVRAEVYGSRLAGALLPAFEHLRADGAGPVPSELTINLWSGAAGEAASMRLGDYCVSADARIVGSQSAEWLAMYDRVQRRLIAYAPDAAGLSFLSRARPLKEWLLLWYGDIGCQPIHGSMVATDAGDGVLLSGPTGSGKSTTALACVRAGFRFVGDDCVALRRTGAALYGISIYSSCLVRPEMIEGLPVATADAADDVKGRALLYAPEAFPGRSCTEAPVRALMIPRIAGGAQTTVRPLAKRDALRALFPHALTVDPAGASRIDAFVALTDLLENTACYRLDLGRNFEQVPTAIRQSLLR